MCLIKKSIFPRFTLRDKIVYKIVYITSILGPTYRTPFRQQQVILNKEYRGEWIHSNLFESIFYPKVSEGYIHSIKDLKSVKQFIKNKKFYLPIAIFKAIIPKYTFYWEGKNDDIASRRIKYIDEIYGISKNHP